MPDPSASVVHLTMRKGAQALSVGSGVLYERAGRMFIATAWHNLTGRHSETLKPLSPTLGLPDNVLATIGQVIEGDQAAGVMRVSFVLPVEERDATFYWVHPTGWPRVDVAVLPIDPDAETPTQMHVAGGGEFAPRMRMRHRNEGGVSATVQSIQACAGAFAGLGFPADQLIGTGDELFVLGYPRGISDFSAAPIWKRATVASDPHIGWERQAKFLIDCASREGMSGAPVIQYSRDGIVRRGLTHYMGDGRPAAALQGIYVGRLIDRKVPREERFFEAQIGTVWKRSVIDEIIDAGVAEQSSEHIVLAEAAVEAGVRERWPQDPAHFERVLAHEDFRWMMVHAVLRHLNGRAAPRAVYDAVLSHAQQLQAMASQQ